MEHFTLQNRDEKENLCDHILLECNSIIQPLIAITMKNSFHHPLWNEIDHELQMENDVTRFSLPEL